MSRLSLAALRGKGPVIEPDPEDGDRHEQTDQSDSGSDQPTAGNGHYQPVAWSKLRHDGDNLGPQYRGKAISREKLEEEEEEEEEERGDSLDDASDDASANASDDASDDVSNENGDWVSDADDDSEVSDDDEDSGVFGKYEDLGDKAKWNRNSDGKSRLPAVSNCHSKANAPAHVRLVAPTAPSPQPVFSLAARQAALRAQQNLCDSLVNVRIRLQKALVASNSLAMVEPAEALGHDQAAMRPETTPAYQAAEEAALRLWQTLHGLRCRMHGYQEPVSAKTANSPKPDSRHAHQQLSELEESARIKRRKTLDQEAHKQRSLFRTPQAIILQHGGGAKGATAAARNTQPLSAALDLQLQSHRWLDRSRLPRSCAPLQAAAVSAGETKHTDNVYDDADFYRLLLNDLVAQHRGSSSAAVGEEAASAAVHWAGAVKDSQVRKQVDRRASKGRKLRYTEHAQLRNFMAPQDRRSWEEPAIDRFFTTLFGKKAGGDESKQAAAAAAAAADDMQGLRLF